MSTAEFKNVSDHAQELTGGRQLEPGETIELDHDQIHDGHNEALLHDGLLLPINEAAEKEAGLASKRVDAREKKLQDLTWSEGDVVPEQEDEPAFRTKEGEKS